LGADVKETPSFPEQETAGSGVKAQTGRGSRRNVPNAEYENNLANGDILWIKYN